jgi:hypothetical protein
VGARVSDVGRGRQRSELPSSPETGE